jgi:hypothetical protein
VVGAKIFLSYIDNKVVLVKDYSKVPCAQCLAMLRSSRLTYPSKIGFLIFFLQTMKEAQWTLKEAQ